MPDDASSEKVRLMRLAIDEAETSVAEDGQIHPKVGAVVVRDGHVLASAHRGELGDGEHAEFTALERKLANQSIVGATVYTTLEPCSTRNHPKVPCATRLIERSVGRVVIGILDPDVRIRGQGYELLRNAGIAVDLFDDDGVSRVEEMNREYIRLKRGGEYVLADAAFVAGASGRSLDEWYRLLNRLYWPRNTGRTPSDLFTHLVEVIGGFSGLASSNAKPGVDPARHLAKAFAWWMTLCGTVGVDSPERMVWSKFPGVCPYCVRSPHSPDECLEAKTEQPSPRWEELARLAAADAPPGRLGDWQSMFARIYPVQQTEEFGLKFARLTEELGEFG